MDKKKLGKGENALPSLAGAANQSQKFPESTFPEWRNGRCLKFNSPWACFIFTQCRWKEMGQMFNFWSIWCKMDEALPSTAVWGCSLARRAVGQPWSFLPVFVSLFSMFLWCIALIRYWWIKAKSLFLCECWLVFSEWWKCYFPCFRCMARLLNLAMQRKQGKQGQKEGKQGQNQGAILPLLLF